MRETRQFTVGDSTYTIRHLKATHARHALQILTKAFAPIVSADIVQAADEAGALAALLPRVGRVLESTSPEEIDKLVALFADETQVVTAQSGGVSLGLGPIVDDHFAGRRFPDQLPWLKECIAHNFDFLADALRGLGAKQGAEVGPGSPST